MLSLLKGEKKTHMGKQINDQAKLKKMELFRTIIAKAYHKGLTKKD